MLLRPARHAAACAAALVLASLVGGCSGYVLTKPNWPWHHSPPPPPTPVHELDITGAAADTYSQYWKRNSLLVDLSGARGSGSITLKPTEGSTWPVRLAFRVTPGAIGALDVHGAQRTLLPITGSGSAPIDLELAPGMFTPSTAQISVTWGPLTPAG
jgi:hypothetical protein